MEKPIIKSEHKTFSGERIEFGPKTIEPVGLKYIQVLNQVRETFAEEGIRELAESMVILGVDEIDVVAFDMYNPLIVGRFDRAGALEYLSQHALNYGLESPVELGLPAPDGQYYILIAGERRVRAIMLNVQKYEIDQDRVDVMCVIKENIPFLEAKSDQMGENSHERPSPLEEAKEIVRVYNLLQSFYPDRKITVKEVSKIAKRSAGIVGDALRFHLLPERVRDLARPQKVPKITKKPKIDRITGEQIIQYTEVSPLSYSTIVRLYYVMELLKKKHELLEVDEPLEQYLENSLLAFAIYLCTFRNKGSKANFIHNLIDEKIKTLSEEARFHQDDMLLSIGYRGEDSSTAMSRQTRDLAQLAIANILYLSDNGMIPKAHLGELVRMLSGNEWGQGDILEVNRP